MDVQIQGLLPPPKAQYFPLLVLALHAFVKNRAGHHVHCNCLPTDIDVFLQCAHPQLFQRVL